MQKDAGYAAQPNLFFVLMSEKNMLLCSEP